MPNWVKGYNKFSKVDLYFSCNKLIELYLINFLSFYAENLAKIGPNLKKVKGSIFCRMKIHNMPRKKLKIVMLNEAPFMVN